LRWPELPSSWPLRQSSKILLLSICNPTGSFASGRKGHICIVPILHPANFKSVLVPEPFRGHNADSNIRQSIYRVPPCCNSSSSAHLGPLCSALQHSLWNPLILPNSMGLTVTVQWDATGHCVRGLIVTALQLTTTILCIKAIECSSHTGSCVHICPIFELGARW